MRRLHCGSVAFLLYTFKTLSRGVQQWKARFLRGSRKRRMSYDCARGFSSCHALQRGHSTGLASSRFWFWLPRRRLPPRIALRFPPARHSFWRGPEVTFSTTRTTCQTSSATSLRIALSLPLPNRTAQGRPQLVSQGSPPLESTRSFLRSPLLSLRVRSKKSSPTSTGRSITK